MSNTIYVYRPTDAKVVAIGQAFDEDGYKIAGQVSSSIEFFRADMGLSKPLTGFGEEKHELYKERYPDGYELKEVVGKEALEVIFPPPEEPEEPEEEGEDE